MIPHERPRDPTRDSSPKVMMVLATLDRAFALLQASHYFVVVAIETLFMVALITRAHLYVAAEWTRRAAAASSMR